MSKDKEKVVDGSDPKAHCDVESVHFVAAGVPGRRRETSGLIDLKLRVAPSVLAAAVASLLPLHGAVAQAPSAPEAARETASEVDDPEADGDVKQLETIQVTGTRIRGGTTPSPVITIDAQQIQEEGFTDLGEVIRSVPQNFSGGQNPGVMTATGSGNNYNQNATGGSSLNLRGIGPDATLTLLNGRRLPSSGFGQAVDISAIPVEAVERIDIVADGASAIYGSDAVAGVGNVVLRRDFDGVTIGTRHGTATDGGLRTREYSAVVGTVWAGGG